MKKLGINVPFLDDAAKASLAQFAAAKGYEAVYYSHETLAEKGAADCEVFFGMMPVEMVKSCTALKWFHCSFAGVDKYCDDSVYASPDVILSNSAGAYGITISEHLICSLLMMMRNMPKYIAMQQERGWDRAGDMHSIYGSTVTVLGMGDIGSNFARRIKAMGAKVRGVRRNVGKAAPDCFDEVYATADLDSALRGADALAICLPDTGETRNIMDERRFKLLNQGAYVLNVGRGSAIDQAGLISVLRAGHLAGAALDVTVPEPLPPQDPLWEAPNLLITPHVSGNMSLSHTCDLILSMFSENFELYTSGRPMKYLVDRKAGY